MQVVSKRFYDYKLENNDANRVLFCCKEAIVNSRHSVESSVDSVWFNNCLKFVACKLRDVDSDDKITTQPLRLAKTL